MARTKASVGAKVSSGKSSKARCCVAPAASSAGSSSGNAKTISGGGGNSVCPRETPKWQRPITNFFIGKPAQRDDDGYRSCEDLSPENSTQKKKPKRNVIESDDEESQTVMNTSLPLEPLNGDSSHKIEEFYPKNIVKGKGKGKKSTNKENVNGNIRRESIKRDLEDIALEDEPAQCSKRVKVDC